MIKDINCIKLLHLQLKEYILNELMSTNIFNNSFDLLQTKLFGNNLQYLNDFNKLIDYCIQDISNPSLYHNNYNNDLIKLIKTEDDEINQVMKKKIMMVLQILC